MSVIDSDSKSVDDDDFQIIDASYFNPEPSDKGLQFHVNLLCPVCDSFHASFLCQKCISSGSFTHSSDPNGPSYSEWSARLSKTTQQIMNLDASICKQTSTDSGLEQELKLFIDSLTENISFHLNQNCKKRERQERLRQKMARCFASNNQLVKKRSLLAKHSNTLYQRKKVLTKELERNNNNIEKLRARYFDELLQSHFTIEFSPDVSSADSFAGAALHIDKEHVFIGPEPQLSSHAALTYCIPAISAGAIFLSLTFPDTIQQYLQLSGPFLGSFPKRDDLGRVYSAVIHAVHLLCVHRGINVFQVAKQLGLSLPSFQSQYNPLIGLHCLAHFKKTGCFDDPYVCSLNGFFGELSPPPFHTPRLDQLSPEPIEIGEEVSDTWESSKLTSTVRISEKPINNRTTPNSQSSIFPLSPIPSDFEFEVIPGDSVQKSDDTRLNGPVLKDTD